MSAYHAGFQYHELTLKFIQPYLHYNVWNY